MIVACHSQRDPQRGWGGSGVTGPELTVISDSAAFKLRPYRSILGMMARATVSPPARRLAVPYVRTYLRAD